MGEVKKDNINFIISSCSDRLKLFIDNPDAQILAYSKQVLDISGIFFIPLGLIFIYRNALQGIGESFVPMMAGVAELGARALVAFTLPSFLGFFGICLADPVAWISASIPLGVYYYITIKKLLAKYECSSSVFA